MLSKVRQFSLYKGKVKVEQEENMTIAPIMQENASEMFALPKYDDQALGSQAHWFIYSKLAPPFSQFDEGYF